MVICLKQGANDLHMVHLMPLPGHHGIISCFVKIQNGFTLPAKKSPKIASWAPSHNFVGLYLRN